MTAWLLTPDRTGTGAIYEVECTSCHAGSGPGDEEQGAAVWALRHARGTGHTGYRRIVTDFQRALRPE
ncbi:DUF7848 domain-containing protein [Streptomyces bambusae]|uniref:DUF7848 domain-containing protein n=1 Tax=Streptomyces bambusae TaxID=1550616 RepID=A0ABS6Z460_9ACTN|nr:hypothetical protein [Streptomyces bambusae]MBW5481505.1 hypothetical protein [Streptomyces bambusae]